MIGRCIIMTGIGTHRPEKDGPTGPALFCDLHRSTQQLTYRAIEREIQREIERESMLSFNGKTWGLGQVQPGKCGVRVRTRGKRFGARSAISSCHGPLIDKYGVPAPRNRRRAVEPLR
jgi:hypothetical protein